VDYIEKLLERDTEDGRKAQNVTNVTNVVNVTNVENVANVEKNSNLSVFEVVSTVSRAMHLWMRHVVFERTDCQANLFCNLYSTTG
jgi:hypothetical protein